MADFKTFMDLSTGKTGDYPAHYAAYPFLVEVDPDDIPCVNCLHEDPEPDVEPEQDELDDEIEPVIPTTTTRRKTHNGR